MEKTIYHVPDMSCEHCVKAIREALGEIFEKSSFEVDLPNKKVSLFTADPELLGKAKEALEEKGFTPEMAG